MAKGAATLAEAQAFLRRKGVEALWEQARPAPITPSPQADPYRAFTQAVQHTLQAATNVSCLLEQPCIWMTTHSWKAHSGRLFGLVKERYLAFSPRGLLLASDTADNKK